MRRNYLNYILDQMQDLDGITIQKQIGGVRFFRNGQVFGAIIGGRFRLRRASCEKAQPTGINTTPVAETKGLAPSHWCAVPEAVISDTSLFTKIIRYTSGEGVTIPTPK
jgi:TfoX/Sxy family transcriptional regulator of competence genes